MDAGFAEATELRHRQMNAMWDAHWYDEFEIANTTPSDARTFALTCDGESVTVALLHNAAPKTCELFWNQLPLGGHAIHCAFFGHAAFWLDRIDLGTGRVLENRSVRLTPGEFIWDPWMHEITWRTADTRRCDFLQRFGTGTNRTRIRAAFSPGSLTRISIASLPS